MIDLVHSYAAWWASSAGDALTIVFPAREAIDVPPSARRMCARDAGEMLGTRRSPPSPAVSARERRSGSRSGVCSAPPSAIPARGWSTSSQDRPSTSAPAPSITQRRVRSSRTPTSCSAVRGSSSPGRRVTSPAVRAIRPRPTRDRPGHASAACPGGRATDARRLSPSCRRRASSAGLGGFVDEHRQAHRPLRRLRRARLRSDPEAAPRAAGLPRARRRDHRPLRRTSSPGRRRETRAASSSSSLAHRSARGRRGAGALPRPELLELPGGRVRIGISQVGPSVAAWAPERKEYAAVGDTVNLAARLMQAAGPGEALVGPGAIHEPAWRPQCSTGGLRSG